jgi:hypothetical protein
MDGTFVWRIKLTEELAIRNTTLLFTFKEYTLIFYEPFCKYESYVYHKCFATEIIPLNIINLTKAIPVTGLGGL